MQLLKLEQDLSKSFNEQDRTERDVFTAFTNAIRTSHERQRAYLEKTKYWGMILSILGSFLSFSFSSLRSKELKEVVRTEMAVSQGPIIDRLGKSEALIARAVKDVKEENMKLVKVTGQAVNDAPVVLDEVKTVWDKERIVRFSLIVAAGYVTFKLLGL